MIHVIVRERDAEAQATEPITSGSVGMTVGFRFSEDWDGMGKTAVFKGSNTAVDMALSGTSCAVPHEVLASAGGHLKIGVYGTKNEGQQVTPTIWADAGQILEGAAPSEVDPTPATESLVQQILEAAEAAETIAQSVRDDADVGEFNGEDGESAYEIAVDNVYVGTEEEWLASLHGEDAIVDATLSNAGEAADAAETGKVKAKADRLDAELLAITPETGASAFTWTLGKYINDEGSTRNGDGWARTAKKTVKSGAVVQNKSPDSVTIEGVSKASDFWCHEYEGSTWLKRTKAASGDFITLGSTTNGIVICWGFSNSLNVTITQTIIDDNFAARIVQEPSSGSGTSDYTDLSSKPQINSVTLSGNKSLSDLGIAAASAVPAAATATPSDPGTAAVGSSAKYAREDHVHKKPTYTASDVGAIAAPSSPSSGDFLVWNGSAWAAQSLSTWQGGNY